MSESDHNEPAWKRRLGNVGRMAQTGWKQGGEGAKDFAGQASARAKATAGQMRNATSKAIDAIPASLAFLSPNELLRWSEQVTKGAATVYDKALDRVYLETHIGGGNHRMFDGGHDLAGAFDAAQTALPDDTFIQEVAGYASALWKDVTTVKGLPFFTWGKDSFEQSANWVSTHVPGASREWFYDACSYDAFEIAGAALPIVGAVFCLTREDTTQLAEILGASGFTSIAAANPLAGIAMIGVAAYAYAFKRNEFDRRGFAKGVGLAGVSFALFAMLGLPILVEFVIVLAVTYMIRHKMPDMAYMRSFVTDQCLLAVQFAKEKTQQHRIAPPPDAIG